MNSMRINKKQAEVLAFVLDTNIEAYEKAAVKPMADTLAVNAFFGTGDSEMDGVSEEEFHSMMLIQLQELRGIRSEIRTNFGI